jgi:hypothetical protein
MANHGKTHDYLGIDFDFSSKWVVSLSIIENIEKIFSDFPEEIRRACAIPASDHLFEVQDAKETEKLGKYLTEEMAQHFHHSVAHLLFLATRM